MRVAQKVDDGSGMSFWYDPMTGTAIGGNWGEGGPAWNGSAWVTPEQAGANNQTATYIPTYQDLQGQQHQSLAPQWLVDQAGGAENIRQIDGGPLGNTSYFVGDNVYSGMVNSTPDGAQSMDDMFARYANSPYVQAAFSGQGSLLNGQQFDRLGGAGQYLGSDVWSGLENEDETLGNLVTALVAAGFGGIALSGAGLAGAGAAGSGGAGAGAGAGMALGDAGLMYAGADAASAASLGGGFMGGAGGTSALGAGALGGGMAFGDAGAMYAGLDAASAGSLGGGFMGGGAGGTAAMGAGSWTDLLKSGASKIMGGSGSGAAGGSNWLGLASTALGALGGAQGQEATQSATREMDPRLAAMFYGGLAPTAMGLLGSQTPAAQAAGAQMLQKGSGLLGQTAPTTATNPYLASIADDMQRRTKELLGENNLAIQGNAVASGGLGGSRQGVAQGVAAGRAADYLQGNVAGLYGNAYNQDQNRLRQDWTIGSGLMNQGVNTPFMPAQNTAQVLAPFTGYGTTTNTSQTGGGWMGAAGGALAGAQLGKNMGWW